MGSSIFARFSLPIMEVKRMVKYRLRRKMSRAEGKLVLKYMQEIIDEYGYVTVADLHNLIDIPSVYIHNRSGWLSLKGARVTLLRKHDAYYLILPHSVPIR